MTRKTKLIIFFLIKFVYIINPLNSFKTTSPWQFLIFIHLKLFSFSLHVREGVLPQIIEEYKKLEPAFKQIDKLQHLVDRVQRDMDAIGIYLNSSFILVHD